LADRAVLARGSISAGHYKALLLSQVIGGQPILTSNFFNIETIKKRFKMITNNHTRKLSFLKYTIGLMAALAITLLFACEKGEQTVELKYNPERTIVYHDKLIDVSEGKVQNIKEMFLAQVETKLVVEQFPQLKGTLPEGEVLMMFDTSNPDDMELAKKFNLMVTKPKKMEMVQGVAPDDDVFVIVEVMPEFPGGEKALRTYIANNINYPDDCKLNGVQGRVYVQFVVDAHGKIVNPRIARGVHPSLDAEALRVIGALPDWKPGTQKGVPVKVSYTVPINFVVQ
jgi:TonB family protein